MAKKSSGGIDKFKKSDVDETVDVIREFMLTEKNSKEGKGFFVACVKTKKGWLQTTAIRNMNLPAVMGLIADTMEQSEIDMMKALFEVVKVKEKEGM